MLKTNIFPLVDALMFFSRTNMIFKANFFLYFNSLTLSTHKLYAKNFEEKKHSLIYNKCLGYIQKLPKN